MQITDRLVGRLIVRASCAGLVMPFGQRSLRPGIYNVVESKLDPGHFRLEWVGKSALQDRNEYRFENLNLTDLFLERPFSGMTSAEIDSLPEHLAKHNEQDIDEHSGSDPWSGYRDFDDL